MNFKDFMPIDRKTGKPVKSKNQGSLHFHCNLGSCYDSLIQEQMNMYVPRHKSYLKEGDLKYVPAKTKEELDVINAK